MDSSRAAPIIKNWSLAKPLHDMARAGVATSMLSLTTAQASFAGAANARRIARERGEGHVKGIIAFACEEAELRAIGRDHAVRLMPQWAA